MSIITCVQEISFGISKNKLHTILWPCKENKIELSGTNINLSFLKIMLCIIIIILDKLMNKCNV